MSWLKMDYIDTKDGNAVSMIKYVVGLQLRRSTDTGSFLYYYIINNEDFQSETQRGYFIWNYYQFIYH